MNYENKYKDALERARQFSEHPLQEDSANIVEYIFPELKESEEEKNIKNLIDELKCSLRAANCQDEACNGGHEKRIALLEWAIAWLEKQKYVEWSEEDEKTIDDAIYFLDMARPHMTMVREIDKCIKWLKSLQERIK